MSTWNPRFELWARVVHGKTPEEVYAARDPDGSSENLDFSLWISEQWEAFHAEKHSPTGRRRGGHNLCIDCGVAARTGGDFDPWLQARHAQLALPTEVRVVDHRADHERGGERRVEGVVEVLAFVREVERLIEAKHTGTDLYNQAIANVMGCAVDAVPPELRKALKLASFGVRYGAQPATIREVVEKILRKVE